MQPSNCFVYFLRSQAMPDSAPSGRIYSVSCIQLLTVLFPVCLLGSSPLPWGIHPLARRLPWIPGLIVSLPFFFWPASTPSSKLLLQEHSLVQWPLSLLYLWRLMLRHKVSPLFLSTSVDWAIRCLLCLWASLLVPQPCLLHPQLSSLCLACLLHCLGDRL